MEPESIKRKRIKYLECKRGGLHEGQKMSFVCVDANSKKKGLICPVCRELEHRDEEVLHLKVFLDEIYKQYSNQQSEKPLDIITQQLNRLEAGKKTMISTLKENVKTLADSVRKLEEKINENYVLLRRIILSQSTISGKIPSLVNMLTTDSECSEADIIEEVKKCSELLTMKNSKIEMVGEANNLLEEYNKNSDTFIAHFTNIMADIPNKFKELPLKVKTIGLQTKESKKQQYTFQQSLKAGTIKLTAENKQAQIPYEEQEGGLVFTKPHESDGPIRKICIKINNSLSESISIGIGDPGSFFENNFRIEMQNEGLHGICSMGIVLNDFDTPSFVFSTGDVIEVTFNLEEVKLSFSRQNGIEKVDLFPPINPEQAKKLSFFCSLAVPGDEVSIVQ